MHLKNLLTLTLAFLFINTNAKILRNKALINKMMSHFQKDYNNQNSDVSEHTTKPNVLKMIQNVLCSHFPTIPCNMIMADESIKKLINHSLYQRPKHQTTYRTTTVASYNSVIDSEELSNFLQVHEPLYRPNKNYSKQKYRKEYSKSNKTKERTHTGFQIGRKKLRKFYPHKTKQDKNGSGEKLTISVEASNRNNFNVQAPESVWRIDYMKHGDPSIGFAYKSDGLRGKILNGPNGLVDDNLVQRRKEVLHPDVYIKKTFVKKNEELLDSDMNA